MSSTTIRMPDELKFRIHHVAKAQGTTAHALILEAIAEKADCAERRLALVDAAKARMSAIAESGETIGWQGIRDHLKARSQGPSSQPPQRERLNGGKEQVYCSQ